MNSVHLIGRATSQPSLKYVGPTNRQLAEFTLAVDDSYAKPDPQTGRRPAFFFFIAIWGQKAETAAQYIAKGQRIGISGRLVQETFTPQGETKAVTKTRIIAENFDLLDKPANHQSGNTSSPPANTPTDEAEIANQPDIPF